MNDGGVAKKRCALPAEHCVGVMNQCFSVVSVTATVSWGATPIVNYGDGGSLCTVRSHKVTQCLAHCAQLHSVLHTVHICLNVNQLFSLTN